MTGGRDERTLGRAEARAFYDAFGSRQDRQAFYEDVALEGIATVELVSGTCWATAARFPGIADPERQDACSLGSS